jgi:hypothetical protein
MADGSMIDVIFPSVRSLIHSLIFGLREIEARDVCLEMVPQQFHIRLQQRIPELDEEPIGEVQTEDVGLSLCQDARHRVVFVFNNLSRGQAVDEVGDFPHELAAFFCRTEGAGKLIPGASLRSDTDRAQRDGNAQGREKEDVLSREPPEETQAECIETVSQHREKSGFHLNSNKEPK